MAGCVLDTGDTTRKGKHKGKHIDLGLPEFAWLVDTMHMSV